MLSTEYTWHSLCLLQICDSWKARYAVPRLGDTWEYRRSSRGPCRSNDDSYGHEGWGSPRPGALLNITDLFLATMSRAVCPERNGLHGCCLLLSLPTRALTLDSAEEFGAGTTSKFEVSIVEIGRRRTLQLRISSMDLGICDVVCCIVLHD